MGVQSIIFEKTKFTIPQAIRWLNRHKHLHYKVDEKPNYYRFRQYDPIRGKRYFTKIVDDGVKYIIDI